MMQLRHRQRSLRRSGLAKHIEDLWEPSKSRTQGRTQTPVEVALCLPILKHVRNWSYDTLEREVRANLVYRAFTRTGDEKVLDAKTLAQLGPTIGPEVIVKLHERLIELARW